MSNVKNKVFHKFCSQSLALFLLASLAPLPYAVYFRTDKNKFLILSRAALTHCKERHKTPFTSKRQIKQKQTLQFT